MQISNLHICTDVQLLLFLGGAKAAKDIVRGDILIGSDGSPQIVWENKSEQSTNVKFYSSAINDSFYTVGDIGTPYVTWKFHSQFGSINNSQFGSINNSQAGSQVSSQIDNRTYSSTELDPELDPELNAGINTEISSCLSGKNKMIPVKYQVSNSCTILQQISVNYPSSKIDNSPFLVGMILILKDTVENIIKQYLKYKINSIEHFTDGYINNSIQRITNIQELNRIAAYKYIPENYLYNDIQTRTNLLNGILYAIDLHDELLNNLNKSTKPNNLPKTDKPNNSSKTDKHNKTTQLAKLNKTTQLSKPDKTIKRSFQTFSTTPRFLELAPRKKVVNKKVMNAKVINTKVNTKVNTITKTLAKPLIKNIDESIIENTSSPTQITKMVFSINYSQLDNNILAEQIKFLVRSLGHMAYVYLGKNLVINLSNDIGSMFDKMDLNASADTAIIHTAIDTTVATLDTTVATLDKSEQLTQTNVISYIGNKGILLANCILLY